MKICICGGGGLGHVCAGVLSTQKDVEVNLLTGHPHQWSHTLSVSDPDGKTFDGQIHLVSKRPEEVATGQDIILLCLPGYMIEETLVRIKPYIGHAAVGSVVSSTGFFFFAHRMLNPNTPLFGFRRVPYISRVSEYGRSARLLGYKNELEVVLEGIAEPEPFRMLLSSLFLTPVILLDNYLEVSLSNSNPILHTGRLYSLFHGHEKEVFNHNIMFYKEWTDDASQTLIDMDAEFFCLLHALGIHTIQPLLEYYESTDATSLTRKISSIPAFQTITSPMCKVPGGWQVDFSSRYFTEDFPFGLRWIVQLADQHHIDSPQIHKIYHWICPTT